jgi:hypothetical protein
MSGPGSLRARVLVAANLRAQQDKRHAYQRPSYAKGSSRARLAWADWWAEKGLMVSLDSSGDIFIDGAAKAMIDRANVQRARLIADSAKWLVD